MMLVTMVMVFMVLMMLVMVMVVWSCWISGSGCEWCAQGECSQYKDRA